MIGFRDEHMCQRGKIRFFSGTFARKSYERDMLSSHWDTSERNSNPRAAPSHPCCCVRSWPGNETNTEGNRARRWRVMTNS